MDPGRPLCPPLKLGTMGRGPSAGTESARSQVSTGRRKTGGKTDKTKKTPRSKSTSPNQAASPPKKPRPSPRSLSGKGLRQDVRKQQLTARHKFGAMSSTPSYTPRTPKSQRSLTGRKSQDMKDCKKGAMENGDAAKHIAKHTKHHSECDDGGYAGKSGQGDLKEFAATVLNELKRHNNYLEKTMQYKTPAITVHKILEECINRIGELVKAAHQAGVAHPSQMLERDLKDLCQIRISAGNHYPDYPLLLTSLQRVMAVAERLLPQSPLFSPPLQPICGDDKKPSKIDLPDSTVYKKYSASSASKKDSSMMHLRELSLAREGGWETLQGNMAEGGSHGRVHCHSKCGGRGCGGRGSSDEEQHGRTSSDEEVRRMKNHLHFRTVNINSASESPSLSLSLSRLTMEDGRHVEGIVGMVAEGEAYTEEDAEARLQTMLMQEHSAPTRGLTAEERDTVEVQGLVEVFEAQDHHKGMQCQICLYSCRIALTGKKRTAVDLPTNTRRGAELMQAVEEELASDAISGVVSEGLGQLGPLCEDMQDAKLDADVKDFITDITEESVALLRKEEVSPLSNEQNSPMGSIEEEDLQDSTERSSLMDSIPETTSEAVSTDPSTERTEGAESGMDQSTERTLGTEEEVELLSADRDLARYLMKLPCGHIFHEVCMTRWFEVGRTCPICRQGVYDGEMQTTGASGPSTYRSLESGDASTVEHSHRTPREDDDGPKHMHCQRPREDSSYQIRRAHPLRPDVPALALKGLNRAGRGSDTSSPLNSTRTLSARSGGGHSARLTMSPRSAFTDAPPRSQRSQESDP